MDGWASLGVSAFLIMFSGMFSGLTLGLMGIDKTQLRVIMESGTEKMKEHASKIEPLRRNGNHLLTTLLIGNTMVNSALAIVMADMTSGINGFLLSTSLILIVGEITPQAICSRHGLAIGAHPFVNFLLRAVTVLLYVLAVPITRALDWMLGEEIGASYTKNELATLLAVEQEMGHLTSDETTMLSHVLRYSYHKITEAVTDVSEVFSVNIDAVLDEVMVRSIMLTGYSRIPVHDPETTAGASYYPCLLFTKDLILYNPARPITVRAYIAEHAHILPMFDSDLQMVDALNYLREGHSHMAIVARGIRGSAISQHDPTETSNPLKESPRPASPATPNSATGLSGGLSPFSQVGNVECEVLGIVTMEDLVEKLIGTTITDEHDVRSGNYTPRSGQHPAKAQRGILVNTDTFDVELQQSDEPMSP